MRKILVTGGAGFIGSCVVEKLLQDKDNFVVAVDNFLTGSAQKLPKPTDNFCFIQADCNEWHDMASIMLSYRFDYVFHYAAVVGVNRTQANPVMVLHDIQGMKHILELCKNTGVKRIFFSSSSEVYGESMVFPQNEHTTPLNSRVPYAVVKNVGEAYIRSYYKEYGLSYTIFRFFNTYGPKQSRDFVVSKFIAMALKGEDITIYGDGTQSRTFCYIDDNIDACMRCFKEELYVNDVLNIGNNNEVSMLELADIIKRLTNSSSNIVHVPALKEGDMQHRCPDIAKMKIALNRPMLSLEEGIKKILLNTSYIL